MLLAGLAVGGAVVVALVLFVDLTFGAPEWVDYTRKRRMELREPEWSLWVALVIGQGALWGVLLPLLVRAHVGMRGRINARDLLVTLSPLIVLSAGCCRRPLRGDGQSPLPGHYGKVTVVTWLGTLIALAAVAGIVRVGRSAWSLEVEGHAGSALGEYVELRAHLRQFLLIARGESPSVTRV